MYSGIGDLYKRKEKSLITLEHVTLPAMEQAAAEAGIVMPIEKKEAWGRYKDKVKGSRKWGE
ncbi:hypothetical protein MCC02038_19600 [Bifidobacteriaceae bacterium MCC02038]|nr:hypothetical protein MCC02038_19600 [Bifidobacteriaceae bacterium MCC02038]